MLRAAEVVADLEDDKVPADEHVVEIVRVDLEQDRGHSRGERWRGGKSNFWRGVKKGVPSKKSGGYPSLVVCLVGLAILSSI